MSQFADHPITLRNVVFTRVVVEAIAEHATVPQEKHGQIQPKNSIGVNQVDGEPTARVVTMSTIINAERDSSVPYRIEVECVGVFDVDPKLDEPGAIRAATITGHSVLYGAIRETVAWLTARQPFGPLALGLSILRDGPPPEESKAPSRQ